MNGACTEHGALIVPDGEPRLAAARPIVSLQGARHAPGSMNLQAA